jgi:UDP-N-acetylmuramate--alanine ligase
VHFVGIGGVGMAGLARHLAARGWRVSGSDQATGRITDWLVSHGVDVSRGHRPELAPGVQWVVRTPAVHDDNPELQAARARGIPVDPRGAVLAALLTQFRSVAICGTHGKTTTAAMATHILREAGLDPSYCIGGELDGLGGVAGVGQGEWLVAEADESDGTLALYQPAYTLITNVEHDHMEHFPDEQGFLACFRAVVDQTSSAVVCCAEDAGALAVSEAARRRITYGFGAGADVRGEALVLSPLISRFRVRGIGGAPAIEVRVSVPGMHNALNALGAAALTMAMGVSAEAVAQGLAAFVPARRRFELVWADPGVTVITDYAHHPTEIRAVLDAARGLDGTRLRAVYQPHRYTRTRALLPAFPAAFEGLDELILTPVYAASESPIPGADSNALLAAVLAHGHTPARLAPSLEIAWEWLRDSRRAGDVLLLLGAGDVNHIADWARRDLGGEAAAPAILDRRNPERIPGMLLHHEEHEEHEENEGGQ